MAFLDLEEGILELFSASFGDARAVQLSQFNNRNGFIRRVDDATRYSENRQVGCGKCGGPAPVGKSHCAGCIRAISRCRGKKREQWKAEGACLNCGRQRDCGKARCRACLDKQREYTAVFKARKAAAAGAG